jgi:hypothetical protein
MKNLSTLFLGFMFFLFHQASYAGLIGEKIEISYTAYYNNDNGNGNDGSLVFLQDRQTLTVQESGSTAFDAVVITDTTITLKRPLSVPTTLNGLQYAILAVDGSLPAIDWANFSESYPTFDANENILKSTPSFTIILDSFLSDPNFSLTLRILAPLTDTVAVPEPPVTVLMLAGLLAFLGCRSQTGSRIRRHFQA